MPTVKFFIKGKANPASIHLRFVAGRKIDFKHTTYKPIDPVHWNRKAGTIKRNATFDDRLKLENNLTELRAEILKCYRTDFEQGILINSDWLKNVIIRFYKQDKNLNTQLLIDFATYHLANLPNKIQKNGTTGVSKATLQKYETNIRKLKDFEKYKGKRYLISQVNMEFHREFIAYLKDKHHLNYNSIGKYLTIIKTICLDAYRTHNIKINDSILNGNFRATREKNNFIVLNEDEINKIYEKDLSKNSYLDNARDWLIIGVWIGARVSDLLTLTKNNIKGEYIEYTAKKTEQKIVMPLHWQVSETLEKYKGEFPRKISSQKFNDYIKKVCSKAGINEMIPGKKREKIGETKEGKNIWRKKAGEYKKSDLVSTHICRRSFATNHYGKLPTPVIMSATGHKTEKMFLNYIGKAPKDNADVLAQYWKMIKSKQEKKTKMKIAN
ncbi:phage integrase SAM-like domain-containing protein [Christiangramia sp. SM2212]|uniref:Phage integrase SAM-like domain-containing protein n=1 Tax=Christiangramia sediminicola TaxID=3073267 RepID=A0ABU1ESS2_9FLAO|nr:phage integrase SAM-like domain-containing protein [Christiangramia sp. SM2212]MDR5591203.1 phage integrase SAM-like domain-containing protein [Christiangramia sp. SM2212]